MRLCWSFSAFVLCPVWFSVIAAASPLPSFEEAAAQAQASTVTVRVSSSDADNEVSGERSVPRVVVLSGVSLGDGLILTPLFSTDGATIRVTIAGGDQTQARPKVLDEYSGLALLEVEVRGIPKLPLADQMPNVGAWVICAAAWGVEQPIVSFGMVSGVDRPVAGTTYPPMLQCNIAVAETSSGAPVVNEAGQLVGVVVAADAPNLNRGWTFAVPVRHVHRLLRVYGEKFRSNMASQDVVVLKRRRPIVGMEIGGELNRVVVKRLAKNGPADRAGMRVGDRIVAVDGIKIRSPYQAVNPTLFKQPGDTVSFVVERGEGTKSLEVVLGGGVVLPAAGLQFGDLFEPKVVVDKLALRNALRQQEGSTAEVDATAEASEQATGQRELLQNAIDRYQTVIDIQQSRLTEQQQEIDLAEKRIEALEAEIAALKKQLGGPRSGEAN